MKAIVRVAGLALVLASGSAAAQQAPRPDTVIREIEADVFAAILRASGMTDVTARDQRGDTPTVDFKTREGVQINARFSQCTRGNHPTRCRIVWYQVCWNRAQLGRDLPDAAALNAFNVTRSTGWAVLDARQGEPRACMRHSHIAYNGTTASTIVNNALAFASYQEAFRRQFAQAAAQTPAPAPAPATPAPATPAPAAPATPAPATPAPVE